ncbi:PTS sugar transporter subunit IIB [Microbacterium sp.]|uniref:PTS sugar transporter subunit IIB n=1 Tax=Microbacterium sp. TaxID=51671 RepID=UPI003A882D31
MRILVVCGAGASSTFVAQRLRRAASARGRELTATAGTAPSLEVDLDSADVVLLGPHLATSLDDVRRRAAPRRTRIILLPPDVFADLDGTRTLALVEAALADDDPPERTSI